KPALQNVLVAGLATASLPAIVLFRRGAVPEPDGRMAARTCSRLAGVTATPRRRAPEFRWRSVRQPSGLCLQARGQQGGARGQSVPGRGRGSPKRVMTLVLKLVMVVMWSPEVVMTWRQ